MVYVLLGTGFEEIEALTPVDLLRRAGAQVKTVSLNGKIITGTSAGTAAAFALALIEALRGADAARAIADQIVIR